MLAVALFALVFIGLCYFVSDMCTQSEWERVTDKYQEVVQWETEWCEIVDAIDTTATDSQVSTLEDVIVYIMPNAVEVLAVELSSLPDRRVDRVWQWVEPADTWTGLEVAMFASTVRDYWERQTRVCEEDGYRWVA